MPRRAARLRIFGMYRAHVLRELALGSPQIQNHVIDPEFVSTKTFFDCGGPWRGYAADEVNAEHIGGTRNCFR